MLLPEAAWIGDLQVHGARPHNGLRLERVSVARPPRTDAEDRPGQHGSLVRTRWRSGARISLEGWCEAPGGVADYSHQAVRARLLGGAEPQPAAFTFIPRGEGRLWRYQLWDADGIEDDGQLRPWFAWTGGWQSSTPWAESVDQRQATYDPTVVGEGAGLAWPLDWPLDWEAEDPLEGLLRATPEGNVASWPLLTITGPVTNPEAVNETTGQTIATTAQLAAGEQLHIDTFTRRVLLGETTERPDLIDPSSVWWSLAPGDNHLRLNGAGMLTGATTLTATWRDARLF